MRLSLGEGVGRGFHFCVSVKNCNAEGRGCKRGGGESIWRNWQRVRPGYRVVGLPGGFESAGVVRKVAGIVGLETGRGCFSWTCGKAIRGSIGGWA